MPASAHWVRIEGGNYRIGSEGGDADEQPVTPVTLARFEMAFAPVTNAEFRCFIEAGGYTDERWWPGELASRWRREGLRSQERIDHWMPRMAALRENFDEAVKTYFSGYTEAFIESDLRRYAEWTEAQATANIEHSFGGRICTQPNSWGDNAFNQPAQPVVGVSLFEAQAYCLWLAAQTGRPLRLPTEAEWEAAARGRQARGWPWASGLDPDPWQINADPAHLRRTSPVGVFPGGDTPEGLCDLSGNVWEWTTSLYTDRLDRQALTTAAADSTARRAVRGGSWYYHTVSCRAGCRGGVAPGVRNYDLGFRVVCCPIQEPVSYTHLTLPTNREV